MDVRSNVIPNVIKEFSISVKEIKKFKKMAKNITSQMLQSEKKSRQMVLQNWLQISTIFIDVLKPKEAGPNN